jgi:inner membrane protein
MASFFAHGLVAMTLTRISPDVKEKMKIGFLAVVCATIPDADVFMFRLGFSYDHWLGHRGFFHSIFFAIIFAVLLKLFAFRKTNFFSWRSAYLIGFFTVAMCSHGILDAMTTGGRGVAFFAPFDNSRYFLPWRVIQVSPMSISRFFSEWGIAVIKSELIWVGIPCFFILGFSYLREKLLR